MISAADYYQRVARPTAEEFLAKNKDVRLAMLACMAMLHVLDYVFQNQFEDADEADKRLSLFTRELAQNDFSFRVVRGFALASKHCRLSKKDLKGFHSKRHRITYPSFLGVMRFGASFFGDTVGGVAVQWTEREWVNLTKAIKSTQQLLETAFPELIESDSSEANGSSKSGPN